MPQPNILFILIDDLGWRDLACTGSDFYETPHIDRLCAQGVRFSNAYASCPVCSPTRASVMTGKYPATVGITDFIDYERYIHPARGRLIDVPYVRDLPHSEVSLASALRAGGYATWHVGKWHLGGPGFGPLEHGFEVNIGGCEDGAPGYKGYFSPWSIRILRDAPVPDGTYLTDYLTDEAIRLLRTRDERPFFMNLWHYAVHTRIEAPAALVDKYIAKAHDLGLDQRQAVKLGQYYPVQHQRDRRIPRRLIQSDPTYAAMVENLDTNIGRVLDTLDELGLAENTLVIFTSDNGGVSTGDSAPTCNLPLLEGKGWMYEGGTREPLIVRWPGVTRPGSLCNAVTTTPDFYPTLLEAAGLPVPAAQHIDGISLLPALRGGELPAREAIYWHYPHYGNLGGTPGSSVRRGDWKLIEFYEDNRLELYNLVDDPGEHRNRAADQPVLLQELYTLLITWRHSVAALLPAYNPDWVPPPWVEEE